MAFRIKSKYRFSRAVFQQKVDGELPIASQELGAFMAEVLSENSTI